MYKIKNNNHLNQAGLLNLIPKGLSMKARTRKGQNIKYLNTSSKSMFFGFEWGIVLREFFKLFILSKPWRISFSFGYKAKAEPKYF